MIENFEEILVTKQELELAYYAMEFALKNECDKVRVYLDKSIMDLFSSYNGQLEKVSQSLDSSLGISLQIGQKYASFSTNNLNKEHIEKFILNGIDMVKMLGDDEFRSLTAIERVEKNAKEGNELGLFDKKYFERDAEARLKLALEASIWDEISHKALENTPEVSSEIATELALKEQAKIEKGDYRIISEEGEYSESLSESILIDSNNCFLRQYETSFDYGVSINIQDSEGNKYSDFYWDANPYFGKILLKECGREALKRALAQMSNQQIQRGKYNIVVSKDVSSRLLTPLLNALAAAQLDQNNSFLIDSLNKKLFSSYLNIYDKPREYGKVGARLWDGEGASTKNRTLIEKGVVKYYFVNEYYSRKMRLSPTNTGISRAILAPFCCKKSIIPTIFGENELISLCGEGLLITGFNGGNHNSTTGDFSFGVKGFYFKNGEIKGAISELLMTGNLLTLWNNIIAAGNDARECKAHLIPSLAFEDVDISA